MNDPSGHAIAGDAERLLAALPGAMIVFDWNGTLINDAERTLAALNATLMSRGLDALDDSAFRHAFRLPMAGFLRDIGVPVAEVVEALIDWQHGIEAREAPLAPGAYETLRRLSHAGHPAGVISAGFTAGVEQDATRLGIRDWLAFLHGSVASKSLMLRQIATSDEPLIYVGDSEYDMVEAIAAGALPIGYAGGYRPAEALLAAGAIAVISDFRILIPPG